jgi:formylglycine-generating enzyme required for sulfatase activity
MRDSIFVRIAVPVAALLALLLTCATGQADRPQPLQPITPVIRELVEHCQPVIEPAPAPASRCPEDMVLVGEVCMDLFEAPNVRGADPMVMLSAVDAEAWCAKQGKRLCTEAEWQMACEGPEHWKYPYGNTWEKGRCNDDKRWRARDEDKLNTWPSDIAKREAERLWQGSPSGDHPGCVGPYGVFDLVGNVEEWTRRADPVGNFRHALRGRFWAGDGWTCQMSVRSHADQMLYYETGTRCCL